MTKKLKNDCPSTGLLLKRLDYAYYRKEQMEKFKAGLSRKQLATIVAGAQNDFCRLVTRLNRKRGNRLKKSAEFFFDNWLVDNGIAVVVNFEEWRKKRGK